MCHSTTIQSDYRLSLSPAASAEAVSMSTPCQLRLRGVPRVHGAAGGVLPLPTADGRRAQNRFGGYMVGAGILR